MSASAMPLAGPTAIENAEVSVNVLTPEAMRSWGRTSVTSAKASGPEHPMATPCKSLTPMTAGTVVAKP